MTTFTPAIAWRSIVPGLALITLTRGATGAPPPTFSIMEIPLPPGAVTGSAEGINAGGDVAGHCTLATGVTLGFVYSGGVSTILPPLPGQHNSLAWDISDAGLVVGYSGISTAADKAVVWSNGQPLSLGTFGGPWSAASGCSSTGLAAGWAQVEQTSSRFHGFVYDGATMHDVGLLLGGLVTDLADVNADGVAVGIGQTTEGHFHAIMVDPADGILDLGTLGGMTSEADAISDAGHVTGRAQVGVPDGSTYEGIVRHAFLWHQGRMIDLGTLPGAGLIESRGLGVNSIGHVVGEASNATLTTHKAFLWADGVMNDLDALLPVDSGWVLRTARAINESGWITGDGTHNGQNRPYLLQPTTVGAGGPARTNESTPPLHCPGRDEAFPAASPATANQFYVVRAAGPLPDEPGPTWAWAIDDTGAVFGTAHVDGSRESRCFVLNDGQYTAFASDQGHPFIWAGAINNAGTFVGTQMATVPIGTKREAFVGAAELLPDLFPQFPYVDASYGRAINNDVPPWAAGSQRLGPIIGIGGFGTFGAYLVLIDGNPNAAIPLSALGGAFGRAEALNDARDVAGVSLTASGPLRAFLRPGAGGPTVNLGTLGGSHSWATDVNNATRVVGWSRLADGGTRAFLYQDAGMIDLGTLGGHISEAAGINDSGRIVGMSFDAQGRPRAFLHADGIMIDLNERIAVDSGWTLQNARAINETGSIAGWGRLDQETRGFVLAPRGPGDATLDGIVDIRDLLAVLGAWGVCEPPCAFDLNGDAIVNVDDLVNVIMNWG